MSDCIHGLEGSWCSLCKGDYEVEYRDINRVECCAPKCSRAADRRLGALPLCPRHLLSVERRIVRVYKPIYVPPPLPVTDNGPGWVYFVRIDKAIKIGFSKQPAKRLQAFGVYSLDTTVSLLSLERGDRAKEKRLHRRFDDLRHVVAGKSNELFRPSEIIYEYIRSVRQCSAMPDDQCRFRALPEMLTCGHHRDHDSIPAGVYSLYADREIPHEDVA